MLENNTTYKQTRFTAQKRTYIFPKQTRATPMTNYNDAVKVLNGKDSRKIAHATWLERIDGFTCDVIAVRYHSTNIILYYADGRTVVRNGGYYTATTKKRINKYSNANVYQKNYVWYLFDKETQQSVEFRDGVEV
jgi:hypothetical protein